MEAVEGQSLVIKMTQKNKETQTVKLGTGAALGDNWYNPAAYGAGAAPFGAPPLTPPPAPPHHAVSCQFYMDREEQLYRRACQMKGIRVERLNEIREKEDDSNGSEEEPPKGIRYRYTLDEMKSYNPYRYINF
ncbi:LOW QUALITY PROTEIN: uncharacterized protein LOC108090882 [Drosophila ficusphila]|uniref:LOW QUALITY PROTEIN: uncharacterized protein LOC108090882 n=1 Tax=Drosophila ficusphila TaxID=30025 RepID=UPI0007E6F7CD|nr:LOW QUALITY PROTEIN: uncharacterized protein LOC108090882 [Drosophila ficusphila]